MEDEASGVFLGGAGSKTSKKNSSGKEGDDDDMDLGEEAAKDPEHSTDLPHYRLKKVRQISNEASPSAESDTPTNLAGSRDNPQARRDGSIFISSNSNHAKSAVEIELVPDSLDAQDFQKMEMYETREANGPSHMVSPPVIAESWPIHINNNRPSLQITHGMDDPTSCSGEVVGHRESIGPIRASHAKTNVGIPLGPDREKDPIVASQAEEASVGTMVVKEREEDSGETSPAEPTTKGISPVNDRVEDTIEATTAELHSDEQEIDFWKGFESESGQEREWMGRWQGKRKRHRKKKVRACSSVYMGERNEKQKSKPGERKREPKTSRTRTLMPSFFPGPQN
ncbi:hypothetical protein SLA2020_130240 [Shorea laevis]